MRSQNAGGGLLPLRRNSPPAGEKQQTSPRGKSVGVMSHAVITVNQFRYSEREKKSLRKESRALQSDYPFFLTLATTGRRMHVMKQAIYAQEAFYSLFMNIRYLNVQE